MFFAVICLLVGLSVCLSAVLFKKLRLNYFGEIFGKCTRNGQLDLPVRFFIKCDHILVPTCRSAFSDACDNDFDI